jgi:hypothetical protein
MLKTKGRISKGYNAQINEALLGCIVELHVVAFQCSVREFVPDDPLSGGPVASGRVRACMSTSTSIVAPRA